MNMHLPPRQSRALAVALLIVVVSAVVAGVAVPAWLLNQRYDSTLENQTDRLKRYVGMVGLRPEIEQAIRAVEARDARQYYFKAASPALSAAELQALVTRIIETHHGRIAGSQALTAKEDGKAGEPVRVAISVQMSASITPLLMILHTLETSKPYLFVDQLTVQANQGRNYKPAPGVEPEYLVSFTVFGFAPAKGNKP